ncbi:MAG: restriction endonuclease subunit S [Armatimonadota bacterium]
MTDIPLGWAEVELVDHVYIAGRIGWRGLKAEEYTDSGAILLSVPNLNYGDNVDFSKVNYISDERYDESPEIQIQAGDTLLVKDGAGIGKLGYVANLPAKATVNSSLLVVRPDDSLIDSKFLFYYLKGPKLQELAQQRITGSATPHLFQKDIKRFGVLMPPLNEQRRIVAKLEKLLARVDACREQLYRVPVLLKRFRQAVLADACSGKLTEDWRDNNRIENGSNLADELPVGWERVECGSLFHSFRSGSTEVPTDEVTAYPILRSSSVRPGAVDLDDVRFLHSEQSNNEANHLADGDLLFTRLSGSLEYVGNCAVVTDLHGKRVQYPDRLFCAQIKNPAHGRYIELCFASPEIRFLLTQTAKSSAGHQRISMGDIRDQIIPLPPEDEEEEIVQRVATLFTFADQVEARYQQAKTHIDRLTQSILAKAFRGGLVPQDPNDEPADMLLSRIREERGQVSNSWGRIRRTLPTSNV